MGSPTPSTLKQCNDRDRGNAQQPPPSGLARTLAPDAHSPSTIELLLVFPIPALQGILGWVTQLPDCWSDALAHLDVKIDCSHSVFVRIHELPPGSPSFRPHPPPYQLTSGSDSFEQPANAVERVGSRPVTGTLVIEYGALTLRIEGRPDGETLLRVLAELRRS